MDGLSNKLTDENIRKFCEYLEYKSNEWKDDWYMNDAWKARTDAFKEVFEVFKELLEGNGISDFKTDWSKLRR